MLLLPNFQRTFGITASRFFRSGCKGKGPFYFGKIFLDFKKKNFRIFLKNFPLFFQAGCKDNHTSLSTKTFLYTPTFLTTSSKNFPVFLKRGRKYNITYITAKHFLFTTFSSSHQTLTTPAFQRSYIFFP